MPRPTKTTSGAAPARARLRAAFLPYQQAWIDDEAPVAIGEKSRRIGWTYASAYRAVKRRLHRGTHLFHTSADLTAAREFIEYCQHWARLFKEVAEDQGEQVIDEADGMTAFVLRFKNGARIVAGSSNPKFFRSKGGDADADEFAFHANPRELYKAMQPAALVWGHQLRVWSTHNGEGSFFAKLAGSAREWNTRIEDRGWRIESGLGDSAPSSILNPPSSSSHPSLHSVTLLDAVDQGLVERIRGLSSPDPVARRDFIEEIRASCPDEDAWNEEYLCRPSTEQRALLTYPMIQACEVPERGGEGEDRGGVMGWLSGGVKAADPDSTTQPHHHPTTSLPTTSLYCGFDVGRKHDRSVLWVLERVGDVYHTRGLRVLEDVPFTAQEELLVTLMTSRAVKRLCVDSTGIGAMLAERLVHRFGHRVEGVHFSAPVKSELAMPLLRLFQDRLIRIPADPAIREDLHKVRKIVTSSNNVRLDADRDAGGHADRFWALALAYHAADDDARTRFLLPSRVIARKPVGW